MWSVSTVFRWLCVWKQPVYCEDELLVMFHAIFKAINGLFLVLFPVGVGGNCLNLLVLLSKDFRGGTANLLLAAVALCDLGFLWTFFPVCLFQYEFFSSISFLVNPYICHRKTLLALINWFSAASIWLIVLISFERLLAVWKPMHARDMISLRRVCGSIAVVLLITLSITIYGHFDFIRIKKPENSSTTAVGVGSNVSRIHPYEQQRFVHKDNHSLFTFLNVLHVVTVILLPFLLLLVTSCFLIRYLRTHNANIRNFVQKEPSSDAATQCLGTETPKLSTSRNLKGSTCSTTTFSTFELIIGKSTRNGGAGGNNSERRVTLLVVMIVMCFACTQLPSGIMITIITMDAFEYNKVSLGYFLSQVANVLVGLGKMINFFLLCTVSAGFRKRLRALLAKRKPTANILQQRRFSPTSVGVTRV